METVAVQIHLPKSVAGDPVLAGALQQLAEQYQRAFEPEGTPAPVTLDEAESAAATLGELIGRTLLQNHLEKQSGQLIAANATCFGCPRCGQPGAAKPEGKPCRRSVLTRVGRVEIPGTRYYCASCRLVFFPQHQQLDIGSEGYSPSLLKKVVYGAAKLGSFAGASDNLLQTGGFCISTNAVRRIAQTIGGEWQAHQDQQIAAFKKGKLQRLHREHAAPVAAVMPDAGRVQTRREATAVGPRDPAWKATNAVCLMTMSSQEQKADPMPEPPKAFLRPKRVKKMVQEIKAQHGSVENSGGATCKSQEQPLAAVEPPAPAEIPSTQKPADKRRPGRPQVLVKTVVATMQNTEHLGWLAATAAHQRGLDLARRKAYVGDGQQSNWSIFEMHFQPWGFIAIVDIIHLITYLYAAGMAAYSKGSDGWEFYCCLLKLAWKGQVDPLLKQLRAKLRNADQYQPWRRQAITDAIRYVDNNWARMNYPEYRRLGLPITSAYIESTIKQINKRIKGSEKFWWKDCCDAMLGITAAYIGNDDAPARFWKLKRPHRRAGNYGGFAYRCAA